MVTLGRRKVPFKRASTSFLFGDPEFSMHKIFPDPHRLTESFLVPTFASNGFTVNNPSAKQQL
jgi:hypothetical protein